SAGRPSCGEGERPPRTMVGPWDGRLYDSRTRAIWGDVPEITVTVSKYLSCPVPLKPMPPELNSVADAWTVLRSVVPLLSNSRPVMLPSVPQAISIRYQWFTL